MKVHQFVREAEAMRLSQRYYPHVGVCPRHSLGYRTPKQLIHAKLDAAYGALWGFRIKHPDSTRSARARRRDLERHQARQFRFIEVELYQIAPPVLPQFHY
jgi:hypothetical protein